MKIKNKKRFIIYIIVFLILIVTIMSILIGINFLNKISYSEYEEKIDIYGLNKLYNNQSNDPNEKVTNIEAVKLVIASTKNTFDITSLVNNVEGEEEFSKILNYAYSVGIIKKEEVNEKNYNNNAKIIDLIKYISRAKYYILNKNYASTDAIWISDYTKYNDEEKVYILDLLADEIIENTNSRLNAYKSLKKSDCNKLIVKYIERYDLLSVLGKSMVTNQEDFPKNSNEYPYIVSDVEKEIYEQDYIVESTSDFYNPADFYTYRKDYYVSTISTAEEYYNTLLNISYENISYDDMYNKLSPLVVDEIKKENLNEYIEYVKQNQIIIVGKATAQVPCIYSDGANCRIRMKLEFEIKNSLTKENVLYMDNNTLNVKLYNQNKYTLYLDAKMGYVLGSKHVYASQQDVYSMLLDISKEQLSIK